MLFAFKLRSSCYDNSDAMMTILPVFQIHGGVAEYDWGTLGKDGSKVGLFGKQIPGFKFDENKPYAEVRAGAERDGEY